MPIPAGGSTPDPTPETTPVTLLRPMINEPDDVAPYTEEELSARIAAASGSLATVAASVWREKSARYADLVDIQEGSSKRSLGSLQGQALKMSTYYADLAAGEDGSMIPSFRAARTRAIERP